MSTASGRKPAARKGQNPRGQGDRLREQLLDAAGEMLLEHGDEGRLTIRGVTRRAGVSPMAFYLHFPDRDALVLAVLERGFNELRAGILAAEAEAPDPAAPLRAAGRAYMRFGLERRGHYRLIFSLPDIFPDAPKHQLDQQEWCDADMIGGSTFNDLVEAVQRCIDAGQSTVDDAWAAATGVWVALHGIVTLRWCLTSFPWPEVDALVEQLLVGQVGIPPDGAGPATETL